MDRWGSMGMALVFGSALLATAGAQGQDVLRVPVVFSGGHETDVRDRGRPVALVADALGVTPETFRNAFSRVHPAQNDGGPTPDEARANKAALMSALAPYGITNDRLDEVSNHYRYRRQRGETWPVRAAKAVAVVVGGKVVRFEVTDGGEGYSSPPTVGVPGFPEIGAKVGLGFDRRFERNGAVRSIALVKPPESRLGAPDRLESIFGALRL